MSTAIEKRLTASQRATQAAQQAADILGLSDAKSVAAALAEAGVESLRANPSFAARVRDIYAEIAKPAKPKRTQSHKAAPDVELAPRRHVGTREANPGAAPDPSYLLSLYGADQLPLALARYKVADLKLAAELVQQRNPGTKPTSRGNRDALIAYIVRYASESV